MGIVYGGLGVIPWSPLAGGFLAGKYEREGKGATGEGRLGGSNPFGNTKFTDRNWRVLDTLKAIAAEVDRPPAQVALAWVSAQPGVTSLLLGASKLDQLHNNLSSMDVSLSPEQLRTLNEVSELEVANFFSGGLKRIVFGGATVQGWR